MRQIDFSYYLRESKNFANFPREVSEENLSSYENSKSRKNVESD